MKQRVAEQRVLRSCLTRQRALAPMLQLELTLQAKGESMTRRHETRSAGVRAMDRVLRTMLEAHPLEVVCIPRPAWQSGALAGAPLTLERLQRGIAAIYRKP